MTRIDDRIRGLLDEGRSLLRRGRGSDAADVFGRVLLLDPHHAEARDGLVEARAVTNEARRHLDIRLEQASSALAAGDTETARALAEEVLHEGGDRDRAVHLLDAIEARKRPGSGLMMAEPPSPVAAAAPATTGTRGRRPALARYAFTSGSVLAFAVVAGSVTLNWPRLMGWLERSPEPSVRASTPSVQPPLPSPGERAVADARRLLEQGDTAGALAALDRVSPEEPAYPFARQLRQQAESVLKARGRAR